MKLFDESRSCLDERASYKEPSFSYLNRTSRGEFTQIRDLLEIWFSRYPAHEKKDLRNSFRSSNNIQHQGAFFELFLHELLLCLGCKIKIHPSLQNTSKLPDFLVEPESGYIFYLEAKVATGENDSQTAARARENEVYEVLDRLVCSPDYFLFLSVRGHPKTPPPAKKLATYVNKEISQLDYEKVREIYEANNLRKLPLWKFEHEGWRIEIRPIPKYRLRGKVGVSPIGIKSGGIRAVDYVTPIRDSIIKKGQKYGELDLPYVIAVNALEPIDQDKVLEALFGREQNTLEDASIVSNSQLPRIPNGVWYGLNGPQYKRISAVLMVTRLSTCSIPRTVLRLYHNPWTNNPYQSVLTQLSQATTIGGKVHWQEGKTVNEIFDFPAT